MTTEELAIKLCDSFESKNWRVEFDEFLIKLIHIRPTTVIDFIEINRVSLLITISIRSEKFSLVTSISSVEQVKQSINYLIEIANNHYQSICKRLNKLYEDLGE